jgi:hypothetical protein
LLIKALLAKLTAALFIDEICAGFESTGGKTEILYGGLLLLPAKNC